MVSKKSNIYTLVRSAYYQGLYRNDELIIEDNRVLAEDALNAVIQGGGISEFHERECDNNWFDDVGSFPKSLALVKLVT